MSYIRVTFSTLPWSHYRQKKICRKKLFRIYMYVCMCISISIDIDIDIDHNLIHTYQVLGTRSGASQILSLIPKYQLRKVAFTSLRGCYLLFSLYCINIPHKSLLQSNYRLSRIEGREQWKFRQGTHGLATLPLDTKYGSISWTSRHFHWVIPRW